MKNMLGSVGWKKSFVADSVPCIPISGWIGDNIVTKSDKMGWWKGLDVKTLSGATVHVHTLVDALNDMVEPPQRIEGAKLRMPVSGVYKIKGVGDVITGRVEQGSVKKDQLVKFIPTQTSSKDCKGKVFSVEMHHKQHAAANPGDNVGLNVKGLNKENMPRVGDVMIEQADDSLQNCLEFVATVQCLDHPGELKAGYTPIAFVRTGRSAVKMTKINWKIGKSTGKQKVNDPPFLKANEMASLTFEPQQPFCADSFKACEGLGRIAIMEGATVVMLGKIGKSTMGEPQKKK
jgi:elongation factor 1-alpha